MSSCLPLLCPLTLMAGSRLAGLYSCDHAALWIIQSVRPSVYPSVRLSHLFHYVPIIVSWNVYYQWYKWGPYNRSRSEVKGQVHRVQNPTHIDTISYPEDHRQLAALWPDSDHRKHVHGVYSVATKSWCNEYYTAGSLRTHIETLSEAYVVNFLQKKPWIILSGMNGHIAKTISYLNQPPSDEILNLN